MAYDKIKAYWTIAELDGGTNIQMMFWKYQQAGPGGPGPDVPGGSAVPPVSTKQVLLPDDASDPVVTPI